MVWQVVVADHEGAVTCFQMKRGDASVSEVVTVIKLA